MNGFKLITDSAQTIANIFGGVKAIVFEVAGTGAGTLSLNSIYAFTPEPASLVMWSLFSVFGVAVGCRHRKATGALPEMESAAAVA